MPKILLLHAAIALFAGSLEAEPIDRSASAAANRATVAVLSFDNNSGDAQFDPLGKGIAAMMISDLSVLQGIQLVERERLQDLINEQNLQHSRYFEPGTAVQVGRFAGAEYVVVGALLALRPRVRIDTRVIRVETGEIVKTAQVTGQEDRLFELQQRLADQLVRDLELTLSPEEWQQLRERQERNRLEDMHAILTLSHAMDMADRGDYVGAVERIYPVARAHPNSNFVRLTYEAMKENVERDAKRRTRQRLRERIRGRIG